MNDEAERRQSFPDCPHAHCVGPRVRAPYARYSVSCACLAARLYPDKINPATDTASSGVADSPKTTRTDAHASRSASCVSVAESMAPMGGCVPDCASTNARSNASFKSITEPHSSLEATSLSPPHAYRVDALVQDELRRAFQALARACDLTMRTTGDIPPWLDAAANAAQDALYHHIHQFGSMP